MLCTDGWGRLEGAFAAASRRIWLGQGAARLASGCVAGNDGLRALPAGGAPIRYPITPPIARGLRQRSRFRRRHRRL